MTLHPDNIKINGKDSLLTRKAEKFRAILSESDSSDDEFKDGNSKKKSLKSDLPSKSKLKKSKLKLGGKAKSRKSPENFTSLKLSHPAITEAHQPTSLDKAYGKTSLQEPEIVSHDLSSQETVVVPPCDCGSMQDISDSDEGSQCSSTLPLPGKSTDLVTTSTVAIDGTESDSDVKIGPIRPRSAKRKVVRDDEESTVEIKKTKIDIAEVKKSMEPLGQEKKNVENINHSSPWKDPGDEACEHKNITPTKSKADIMKPTRKALAIQGAKQVTSLSADKNHVITSKQQATATEDCLSNDLLNERRHTRDHAKEVKYEPSPTSKPAKKKPKETSPVIEKSSHDFLPTKTSIAKKEVINTSKDPTTTKKKAAGNQNKEPSPKKKQMEDELGGATNLEINSPITEATPFLTRSEKIQGVYKLACVPKQQSLPKQKARAWNPPGKAIEKESTPCSSPSTGRLRLGLSRKRLSKPLHPEIKPKTC